MTNVSQSGSGLEPRTLGVNFRSEVVVNSSLFVKKKNCHNVQQQCQQQLDYRTEGREAAPVRGQCPENQGTKMSTQLNKHGRSSRSPAEWRRQTVAETTQTGLKRYNAFCRLIHSYE